MTWTYNGEVYDTLPEDYYGFVYIITEKETQMKYVGKKFFYRTKTLPITKTRKRRKKTLVESDWRTYCGSSERVQELVESKGLDAFTP